MPIIKIQVKKRTHPYVMIDKRPLDDPRLSWAARGLLAHLLCRPPPWRLVFANLLRQSPDGRYVLKRLLNELREFGYAKIKRLRDAMGKMAGSTWFIYEDPELFGDTEKLVCPLSVKSDPRQNLALGKVRQSDESETINNEYSNNPTNNNKTSKRLLAPDGEVSGLDLDKLRRNGEPPEQTMKSFRAWIEKAAGPCKPVFVGFNACYDWQFVNWYLERFAGGNPFGFAGLDIKSYYMGFSGKHWSETTSGQLPPEFQPDQPQTHNALDDARAQASIFAKLLRQARHNTR